MCPISQPHCTTYHNVLWVQVITEGAIIKVDLVESLLCKADHFTLIEATILVLADDYLSRGQILECSLSSLGREKSLFIQWLNNKHIENHGSSTGRQQSKTFSFRLVTLLKPSSATFLELFCLWNFKCLKSNLLYATVLNLLSKLGSHSSERWKAFAENILLKDCCGFG